LGGEYSLLLQFPTPFTTVQSGRATDTVPVLFRHISWEKADNLNPMLVSSCTAETKQRIKGYCGTSWVIPTKAWVLQGPMWQQLVLVSLVNITKIHP
jgi:hypothetical protein